jgi:site-specific recombinase XerD
VSKSTHAEQGERSTYEHSLQEFLTFLVNRKRSLKPFLAWLVAQGVPLSSVSPVVITKYFTGAVAGRWKRTTVSFYVQSLRSFFRYASSQGWCMAGIAESIDAPRLYTYENLPQGPSWGDVKKLLASVNGASPSQLRSRCAILLCAVYGLRVGEVCRLRLEDIDWAEESLCASLQTKNCEVTSPPEASIRSSCPCADICSSKLSGVASLTTKGPAFHSLLSPVLSETS